MLVSRTPFRISFFGGGTDYPAWYRAEGGAVLSTTINKYCYISCRELPPFFSWKHRIVWSHIETVSSISEILHPAVREGLRLLGFDDSVGLEVHHQGDLPARAGMGSSSTFAVGLIRCLLALRGKTIERHELALRAIELEQRCLRESVGSQDQVAAAYGGLNTIYFERTGDIRVEPVPAAPQRIAELQSNLLLFYTGTSRLASEVAAKLCANLASKSGELRRMRKMVDRAQAILAGEGSLDELGRLLHQSWMAKRQLAETVSNPRIDGIYSTAMASGALGGKLLGAGSTGFMLFYVPREQQRAVIAALESQLHVPFRFERTGCQMQQDLGGTVTVAPRLEEESGGLVASSRVTR